MLALALAVALSRALWPWLSLPLPLVSTVVPRVVWPSRVGVDVVRCARRAPGMKHEDAAMGILIQQM
eukprot:1693877-Rhodomonas_salina.1